MTRLSRFPIVILLLTLVLAPASVEGGKAAPAHLAANQPLPLAGEAASPPPNGQPFTMGFPRLGMWWPDVWEQPLQAIARYDWVIFFPWQEERVPLIKQLNPALIALNSTNACEVWFDPSPNADPEVNADVRAIPAEWFLTQVGATLTQAVNATTTTFHVSRVTASDGQRVYDLFVPGDTAVIEGESVYVTAVNKSAKTLTVRRGYVRPASAHAAGTRIAAHITFWPNSWVLNLSTLSPTAVVDPAIGPERWAQYHARQDAHLLDNPIWDGMLIDRADSNESWLIGNSTARTIDPDQSNRLLSDYSAFDAAWNEGLRQYLALLRQYVGDDKLLYANWGIAAYDLLNGNNFEGFPDDQGTAYGHPWNATVFGPKEDGSYFDWMTNARQPNLTMIETYEDDGSPDPWGDDNYENPCLRPGFKPNYRKMRFGLTTALLNDGFFSYEINTNGHGSLCLLWFDEYDGAGRGRGYLGQPLGAAYRAVGALTTPNLVNGGGMDSPADLQLWDLWTANGYSASASIDTNNKVTGAGSLRVQVTQAGGVDWRASLTYTPVRVAAGNDYTLSFWARADAPRPLTAWIQRDSPPWENWVAYPAFQLTTTWQQFEVSLPASGSDNMAAFSFGFGQSLGTVWIDGIRVQQGSREVWRRDYQEGIALVNATSSAQVVDLGGVFAHLLGRQDPLVNNGRVVSQVTLPPRDGVILLRWTMPQLQFYLPLVTR